MVYDALELQTIFLYRVISVEVLARINRLVLLLHNLESDRIHQDRCYRLNDMHANDSM
jgi:hypothetical protein